MIKYTILYKNGKTWNGKAQTRADIMEYCWNLIKQKRDVLHVTWIENDGDVSVVWPRLNYTGAPTLASSILCSDHYNIKPTRTPNPASVTKKQKAFDKAYAEWKINNSNLVDYDDGSGYMKYVRVGNGDTSIKAYKKWLWEQKQAELKSVLKETSLDEFVRVDVPDDFSTSDGWIPWNGGECPVPKDSGVEVRTRGGVSQTLYEPHAYWWSRHDELEWCSDIVAYRLLDEDVNTSITFSEPVEVPVNITINWDGIYKPWKEAAIEKYKTHSYDKPIKTTYTFWLGQDGSVSDEL